MDRAIWPYRLDPTTDGPPPRTTVGWWTHVVLGFVVTIEAESPRNGSGNWNLSAAFELAGQYSTGVMVRDRMLGVAMKTLYLTAAIAVFAAPALVQSISPATAAMSEVSTPQFAKTVAASDMFEIQSTWLAAEMSKNANVQAKLRPR